MFNVEVNLQLWQTVIDWTSYSSLPFKKSGANLFHCLLNCLYSWRAESWGTCSSNCGHGFRTRTVACVQKTDDSKLFVLADSRQCPPKARPKQLEICENLPPCIGGRLAERGRWGGPGRCLSCHLNYVPSSSSSHPLGVHIVGLLCSGKSFCLLHTIGHLRCSNLRPVRTSWCNGYLNFAR